MTSKYCYTQHPKYQELQSSGIVNDDEAKVIFQVYLDLIEVKNWWNVALNPCFENNTLFITGHETQYDERCYVLPCSADKPLSSLLIQDKLEVLQKSFQVDTILVALIQSDSTVVYYRISRGLVPPEKPEELEVKKQKRFRYQQRRRQRHVKHKDIYEAMEAKKELNKEDIDQKSLTTERKDKNKEMDSND